MPKTIDKTGFWVNDVSEFFWEVVFRGRVEKFVRKTGDDDNRDEAEAVARKLNAARRKRLAPK